MEKKTVVDEVRERIVSLTAKKEHDLDIAKEAISRAQTRMIAAADAANQAAESMDIEAWRLAAAEKSAAETEEQMYKARLEQIQRQKLVSEEESDRVIDSLRDYLRDAENTFEISLGRILRDMQDLYNDHISDVRAAEGVINTWTSCIHENYRSDSGFYYDPASGLRTNRSPHPVRVPTTNGWGGGRVRLVRQFLSNFETLLAEESAQETESDE